ncbi:hypothetical protein [Hyalangium rubrum]|uniref:Uncharacterized protein n=1 Tax=Hyalangium rubrum TaxID=3103134 RepID=A0ABU5HFY6_9BACT|nr:hypothetical protein [Hyalangium sp. s54d21]MDY7230965.1 hypothetical protein [Hyalangium sp. s54d21]
MHADAEPVPPPSAGDDTAARLSVHAWSPALRVLAAAAQVLSAANLLYLVALSLLGVLEGYDDISPLGTALRLLGFSLLPLVLVWLLRRFTAASLHAEPTRLVLQLRGVRFEIPRESITRVEPWRLPLPGTGLALRMKSGRRFDYHLQASTLAPLLTALGDTLPTAAAAAQHPSARFGQARHDRRRWFLDAPAFKFGLFPLLPAGIMFRAHQYITFGGPFGEYDAFGLAAYLKTFAGYWLSFTLGLLLFAGFWRILAEVLAFPMTWLLPSYARGVRRAAEWLCRLVYYVGFPALMAWRFLG